MTSRKTTKKTEATVTEAPRLPTLAEQVRASFHTVMRGKNCDLIAFEKNLCLHIAQHHNPFQPYERYDDRQYVLLAIVCYGEELDPVIDSVVPEGCPILWPRHMADLQELITAL